ncbi:uncharacterized protein LOC111614223 [Centruroides sculpturatus]|uniref:uncharacterized protein LOC111614223 n=1 Tax=Centruroides sculpturatus TaxID=218467 RepID=UPI000C6E3283|nr:uncharacterized protein LOC111614223 [Centruroides sculpturatus]
MRNIFFKETAHGIIAVEFFIFISAFLITYLRKNNIQHSTLYYVVFLVKRYIRLTFMVLCFVAFAIILPILLNDCNWHFLIYHVKIVELNWWKLVLHIYNFENNFFLTIIQYVWIMNATLQLNIITAPILFILDRWPKIGIITIITLSLIGFSTTAVLILTYNCTFVHGYSTDVQ